MLAAHLQGIVTPKRVNEVNPVFKFVGSIMTDASSLLNRFASTLSLPSITMHNLYGCD